MSTEVFSLITVARVLADDVELAEVIGFPEISTLDESERKWRPALQTKTKSLLEDPASCPALWLHRRRAVQKAALHEVEMTFEPPRRLPEWQEPVQLRIPLVTWGEDDLYHAWVPALNIQVFAPRASLLDERVAHHIRLVLAGRRKQVTLLQLARLTRIQSLRLGSLTVSASLQTPRQVAAALDEEKEESSVLARVAEELPPFLARALGGLGPAKGIPAADPRAVPAVAFEMENEVARLAEALTGRHRRSVLLVGPAGSGKTALVRELARRRRDLGFAYTPFWSTHGARLMTGEIGFGMWQERCQRLCREVDKSKAILHLGSLAELLEVGKATRGEQSIGGFLRPWIARGELLGIAECTPEQLGTIERLEPHLLEAFHQMTLPERTPDQVRLILRQALEEAPGASPAPATARLNQKALDRLHQLHLRYATYSANPARPLRFLRNLLSDRFPEKAITEAEVTAAFSRETGLPLVLLEDQMPLHLERTGDWFSSRVIGQPEATAGVVDLLAMIKARLARPRKPLASFLFIGPTGTGKTEMAKAMAEFLFSDPARLVRFDLNEFSDALSVQRLIGGPLTGEAEGLLTARVREQPFSVLLFDEFEKADPAFFDLLLQMLGDGRLTDAAGRVADFCNTVIVMTSNLGAPEFQRGPAGFRANVHAVPAAQEHFTEAVQKFLRPEIFNRLDAVVPFRPLGREEVAAIARRHLDLVRQRDGLRLRPVEWQVTPAVAEHLAERGHDPRYGARPLKRAIERELLVPLAEALNAFDRDTPVTVALGAAHDRLTLEVRSRKETSTGPSASRFLASDDLAGTIVSLRRLISRLQHCPATSALENQVTLLESLERRLAKAGWKHPSTQERLAALPHYQKCLRGLAALAERASHLETEALGLHYQREELDAALFAPEVNTLEKERQRLVRELFRLGQNEPDDVVLAFYCEHQETLFTFAAAFRALGEDLGELVGLEYFSPPPGGRSRAAKLVRETPKKLDAFFATPPARTVGLAMHLRGDLFRPRFAGEAGLHVLKDKTAERLCLVEAAAPPLAGYEPPKGIERSGSIKAAGTSLCRVFDRENKIVIDRQRGERPWNLDSLEKCLAELIEERLNAAIEAVADEGTGP